MNERVLRRLLRLVRVASRYEEDYDWTESNRYLRRGARVVGLEHLGTGANRAVFRIDKNRVIKIPMDDAGRDANEREATIWSRSRGRFREHLVPVLEHTQDYLIMEYATPSGLRQSTPEHMVKCEWLEEELLKRIQRFLGWAWIDPDLHGGNITDDYRIIDYAGYADT